MSIDLVQWHVGSTGAFIRIDVQARNACMGTLCTWATSSSAAITLRYGLQMMFSELRGYCSTFSLAISSNGLNSDGWKLSLRLPFTENKTAAALKYRFDGFHTVSLLLRYSIIFSQVLVWFVEGKGQFPRNSHSRKGKDVQDIRLQAAVLSLDTSPKYLKKSLFYFVLLLRLCNFHRCF